MFDDEKFEKEILNDLIKDDVRFQNWLFDFFKFMVYSHYKDFLDFKDYQRNLGKEKK